ncbi:uncharacterized protein LOC129740041 [Uranotaenia lowii]|uniref:uncharacterized protein LOC129740041 n=1 Tax=Uranotaenia lowii TaxID=190385 RepID=UPI0024792B9A|nr:uncharacterized protein LOC129740041 [Uranotaenia lowii]
MRRAKISVGIGKPLKMKMKNDRTRLISKVRAPVLDNFYITTQKCVVLPINEITYGITNDQSSPSMFEKRIYRNNMNTTSSNSSNSKRDSIRTSSSESIIRLLKEHREAIQNVAKQCMPMRDLDEFGANLRKCASTLGTAKPIPLSSSSCTTFVPHHIYTIDEQTEHSNVSLRKSSSKDSSNEELRQRLQRLRQLSAAARNVQRPISRRGSLSTSPAIVTARINYHESIVNKFELIDRFLQDQDQIEQENAKTSEGESLMSITQRYNHRSQSSIEKNRVIKSLCCSCI